MKAKYILGIFIVLLIATTACAYAAEQTIGDKYKFTVPDGYNVYEANSENVTLTNDSKHVITIVTTNFLNSEDVLVKSLEKAGSKVQDHHTFKYGGKDIREIDYKDDGYNLNMYSWDMGSNEYIIIIVVCPSDETAAKWEASPAKTIFDTMTRK